jgi:hypothetical protein
MREDLAAVNVPRDKAWPTQLGLLKAWCRPCRKAALKCYPHPELLLSVKVGGRGCR